MGPNRFNGAFYAGMVGLLGGILGSCIPDKLPVKEPVIDKVVVEPTIEPKVEPEIKVDPKPEPKKEDPKPESMDGTIVMYTSDSCIYCVQWKSNELQKVKDATWKFKEIYVTDGPVPRFDIHIRGRVYKHTGYMRMSDLRQIVNSK